MSQSGQDLNFKSLFIPFTTKKAVIFIAIIGFVVYFNMLFNGFVGDDNGQIVSNTLIHSISNLFSFFRGSTFSLDQANANVGIYYKPLLSTAFSIIYTFFGANAFFFHLIQLVMHILNTMLIFVIFKKHLGKIISFILALIFLLHPINNEAVVYISNLQEELFAFFGFLALFLTSRNFKNILVAGLVFLSLLSKETGIIFVAAVIVYNYLFAEKVKSKNFYFTLLMISTVVLYFLIRIFVGNTGFQTHLLYMSENATFMERLFTIPSILFYYIKMAFLPVTIAFGWYWVIKTPTLTNFFVPLFLEISILIILLSPLHLLRKNNILWKSYIFFFVVFIFSLSLVMQIFPLDITAADRWFYLPLFGLLGMMGIIIEYINKSVKINKHLILTFLIIIVMLTSFFAIKDVIRNVDWNSDLSLCSHDVKINLQSYLLQYCLADEYYNNKKLNLAENYALTAVNLYPKYFLSWYALGRIYYDLGKREKAKLAFENTLIHNEFGYGSGELALIFAYEKNPKAAKEVTQKYLKILPNSSELWYALALSEYELGNKKQAIAAAKNAYLLEKTPTIYKTYYLLSNNLPINF